MMKKQLLFVLLTVFASCQNKPSETSDSKSGNAGLPYEVKKVQNWQMNPNSANLISAMKLIKTFEALDTVAMSKVLADSVWVTLDGYQFKGTKSQFLSEIQGEFEQMNGFKITMQDYESVINKDKTEEWVSLWYSQISTTKDGKTDTVNLFNDIKLKDGKVAGLSEYIQHPMKK